MVIGWAAYMHASSLSPHWLPTRVAQEQPGWEGTQIFLARTKPGRGPAFAPREPGSTATPTKQQLLLAPRGPG